jgi:hypothetical protein
MLGDLCCQVYDWNGDDKEELLVGYSLIDHDGTILWTLDLPITWTGFMAASPQTAPSASPWVQRRGLCLADVQIATITFWHHRIMTTMNSGPGHRGVEPSRSLHPPPSTGPPTARAPSAQHPPHQGRPHDIHATAPSCSLMTATLPVLRGTHIDGEATRRSSPGLAQHLDIPRRSRRVGAPGLRHYPRLQQLNYRARWLL